VGTPGPSTDLFWGVMNPTAPHSGFSHRLEFKLERHRGGSQLPASTPLRSSDARGALWAAAFSTLQIVQHCTLPFFFFFSGIVCVLFCPEAGGLTTGLREVVGKNRD
jgi:hypothetical protein